MLATHDARDEELFVATDRDGMQLAISGPYRIGESTTFVVSMNQKREVQTLQMFAGDPDDARELARQILRHVGLDDGPTVEIGGQVMTQAQFDAARYPLLHPETTDAA